ncbi:MAG TPA: ribosome-associated translation inhibitor RaiA [Candidatus Polarisedimenticolia bacterium]|nr:ribosome-associated translation inhibitor RaiA [Candidatus Polarisedimenticolia bacterium]
MKVDITGRNIDITPAIRDFTRDKLLKLEKWIDDVIEAHVILSVEKHRHQAEIVIKARHRTHAGEDETGDMYVSIGNAVDKIEKQARRLKEKAVARRKHALPAPLAAAAPEGADGREKTDPAGAPRIIRMKEQRMKPMSLEDAALAFRDSNREFLVFRDARSQRISVMYRRKDGNLGLIEPES